MYQDFGFKECGKDMGSFDVQKHGVVRSENKIDSPCKLWAEKLTISQSSAQMAMLVDMEKRPYYSERFAKAVRAFAFDAREVDKMYEIFEKIDFNGGGSIDVDEFFTWLVCVQDDASITLPK